MTLVVIDSHADHTFTQPIPVGLPVDEPVSHTRTALHQTLPETNSVMGIWECTPGVFHRQVAKAEYSYILSGEGHFTPEGGKPVPFKEGSVLYFAPNTEGVWDVKKAVRKTYIIIDENMS